MASVKKPASNINIKKQASEGASSELLSLFSERANLLGGKRAKRYNSECWKKRDIINFRPEVLKRAKLSAGKYSAVKFNGALYLKPDEKGAINISERANADMATIRTREVVNYFSKVEDGGAINISAVKIGAETMLKLEAPASKGERHA